MPDLPIAAAKPLHTAVEPSTAEAIAPLRELHRAAMNCHIIHDSFPRRGFCDCFMLLADGLAVGYGFVDKRFNPGTLLEFYVTPAFRSAALPMFRQLIVEGRVQRIRVQTNDRLLLLMLYDCATGVTPDHVLFADGLTTSLPRPDGVWRRKPGDEEEWQVVIDDTVAASAGLLFHYNPPFADVYMDVHESFRRRGFGSYAVQEIKRVAYELGRIPAARCNADNPASRRTLERAGMLVCGRILAGDINPPSAGR